MEKITKKKDVRNKIKDYFNDKELEKIVIAFYEACDNDIEIMKHWLIKANQKSLITDKHIEYSLCNLKRNYYSYYALHMERVEIAFNKVFRKELSK